MADNLGFDENNLEKYHSYEDYIDAQVTPQDHQYLMDPNLARMLVECGCKKGEVEEKIGEQKFRVLSEMRILAKIRVVIFDFVGYVDFLAKFGAKLDFRV